MSDQLLLRRAAEACGMTPYLKFRENRPAYIRHSHGTDKKLIWNPFVRGEHARLLAQLCNIIVVASVNENNDVVHTAYHKCEGGTVLYKMVSQFSQMDSIRRDKYRCIVQAAHALSLWSIQKPIYTCDSFDEYCIVRANDVAKENADLPKTEEKP